MNKEQSKSKAGQDLTFAYKKYSYKDFSRIHQMTAYLAMFPPSIPHHFICKYSKEGDLVFDPFSGRGTSAFEACRLGRIGIGNDLNPLAFCLTSAKVNLPQKSAILERISQLKSDYVGDKFCIDDVPSDIRMLYEETTTLPQLLYLKNTLQRHRKIDNFILAILSGIMHGKHRKDGSSIYCSIDMPNTFSMSPNYVRSFIDKHNLQKIKQDVFGLLEQRVTFLFQESVSELQNLSHYKPGACFEMDALDSTQKIIEKYGKNSIGLIVTSPPYLKNINYAKYNWIRLWLLDSEAEKHISIYQKNRRNKKLKDNLAFEQYAQYLQKLFDSWFEILKADSYAFVVIGDIDKMNLAQEVWKYIEKNGGCRLRLGDILEDAIVGERKVTKIWGAKKGKATAIDRILMLQKA